MKFFTKKTTILTVAIILIFGLGFYSGNYYTKSKMPTGKDRFQAVQNQGSKNIRILGNNNAISGEILTKEDKNLTLKLRDGGSKIIFFTENTPITKNVAGATSDLSPNKTIFINGKTNQDGSVNADSIQIRPENR